MRAPPTTRETRHAHRDDTGAADALGLVVLVVPMMLFAVLVFYVGRDVDGRAQVRAAAEAAAQAAALERDAINATAAAQAAAEAMLDRDVCPAPTLRVVYPPLPSPDSAEVQIVEVTLRCDASNAGFEALDATPARDVIPDDRVDSVRAFATLDVFRARR